MMGSTRQEGHRRLEAEGPGRLLKIADRPLASGNGGGGDTTPRHAIGHCGRSWSGRLRVGSRASGRHALAPRRRDVGGDSGEPDSAVGGDVSVRHIHDTPSLLLRSVRSCSY
jgi:hypothetical protein